MNRSTHTKNYFELIGIINIGARFYDAIDEANARNDLLEADLAKDIESTRLFR